MNEKETIIKLKFNPPGATFYARKTGLL